MRKDLDEAASQIGNLTEFLRDDHDALAEHRAHIAEELLRIDDILTSLQSQISALANSPESIAPVKDEPSQIMPGHVRFSDRKRNYEASKRKPLITESGKQIAENSRLIASGTRKPSTKS
jgi:hypothetical protein